jgi:hypothetical protein
MAKQLDVYKDWLGIPNAKPPLNHYQLLRLPQFEDDPAKVRMHYRKMNSHVRKFASGDYAQQSQDLLNELAKAMLCLTDTRRKGEYDASLGRTEKSSRKKHTLEQILVGRKIITTEQLEKARSLAKAINLEIRDAVMQQKAAAPDAVMSAYAESLGLPYIDLGDVGVNEEIAPQVPAMMARQHSCVPVMIDNGQLLMASPNPIVPEIEEELRLRLGMPIRTVICTPADVNAAVATHYPKEAAAAQMAAGGGAGPKMGAATKKKKAAKEDDEEAEVEVEAMDPADRKKRQQLFALLFACLTAMPLFVLYSTTNVFKSIGVTKMFIAYPAIFVAGGIAAVIGLIVGGLKK